MFKRAALQRQLFFITQKSSMETMTRTTFKELSAFELEMLKQYATGKPYEKIQQDLSEMTLIDVEGRRLGERFGGLKKKMGYATQFQLGYEYRAYLSEQDSRNQYSKGYLDGQRETHVMISDRQKQRFINRGAVQASMFWLALIAIVSHYYL